jgi:DNA-binding CsgD family transcriptional regulator
MVRRKCEREVVQLIAEGHTNKDTLTTAFV